MNRLKSNFMHSRARINSIEVTFMSVATYATFACELPLLAFHVAVTIFVGTLVWKRKADYCHPFYKLFLLQCFSNYMCFTTVSLFRFYRLFPL